MRAKCTFWRTEHSSFYEIRRNRPPPALASSVPPTISPSSSQVSTFPRIVPRIALNVSLSPSLPFSPAHSQPSKIPPGSAQSSGQTGPYAVRLPLSLRHSELNARSSRFRFRFSRSPRLASSSFRLPPNRRLRPQTPLPFPQNAAADPRAVENRQKDLARDTAPVIFQ
jgi:hypothetical protein